MDFFLPLVLWGRAGAQFGGLIVLTASAVSGSERLESALAMIDERANFNQNGARGVFRGGKQINQSTRPSILPSRSPLLPFSPPAAQFLSPTPPGPTSRHMTTSQDADAPFVSFPSAPSSPLLPPFTPQFPPPASCVGPRPPHHDQPAYYQRRPMIT